MLDSYTETTAVIIPQLTLVFLLNTSPLLRNKGLPRLPGFAVMGSNPLFLQVGSFNFDNRKMVFESYLLPVMPNHTKSILDYDVQIRNLRPEATYFVPAETGQI